MKKVLLSIDGITPNKFIVGYAVELCKRIKAELSILQLVERRDYRHFLKKQTNGLVSAVRYMDKSMMAITFAEAGEHDTAINLMPEALNRIRPLLADNGQPDIDYQLQVTHCNKAQAIFDYVDKNKDVVMTIYDPGDNLQEKSASGKSPKTAAAIRNYIQQRLPVPLIVIEPSG